MADKHLFTHIFYENMADNFEYGFKWVKTHKDVDPLGQVAPKACYSKWEIQTIDQLLPSFYDKPCFIIGSGPSLDKNIKQFAEFVKSTDRQNYIILAADGAIWDLKAYDIKPDFIISCEADGQHNRPIMPTTDQILDGGDLDYYKDVPIIANTWLNAEFFRKWPCERSYWYVNCDPRYETFWDHHPDVFPADYDWPVLVPRASVVGFHGIEVAKYLQSSEIILLGFDMSVTEKNKHHSKNFNLDWEDTNTNLQQCYSDHMMWFQSHFDCMFDGPVINCTEGGALVEARCHDLKVEDWSIMAEKLRGRYGTI